MHYEQAWENVVAYYTENDGCCFASETIEDKDYNARMILDFISPSPDNWQVSLTVRAIDPDREIRVVPFWYVKGENKLPYSTEKDTEYIKITQKTL